MPEPKLHKLAPWDARLADDVRGILRRSREDVCDYQAQVDEYREQILAKQARGETVSLREWQGYYAVMRSLKKARAEMLESMRTLEDLLNLPNRH